ncbi:Hemolysin-type calcium-binding repeat-containing protein [Gemmobacter aquatilis]|uniref:Hemolysin-type calcium-binding repeat-containing protein n=1 Tax=Gemmobacter aquatilis TaxID=933059 RepID=A0A1H8FXF3_9RHOB|nr:calcium-binding protein [Gemmobacter aquatilis]SEN36224.1 Hemolysin-type calcium-binding repeat-containing protein [Gemmobacter aquatilis]
MPTISYLKSTDALASAFLALFGSATVSKMTDTNLVLDTSALKFIFSGTGLAYDVQGDVLTGFSGGEINGLNVVSGDNVVARFIGLEVDASAFPGFDDPAAPAQLLNYLATLDWTINGTQATDTLNFGPSSGYSFPLGLTINASGGGDVIVGAAGNDEIHAGSGNDKIYDSAGDDKVYGDAGNDTVFEVTSIVSGNDSIYGGAGKDSLAGGAGDDLISGDTGADKLWGGADNDMLYGGAGGDKLYGDDGADSLYGDAANDQIFGGGGADWIYAGKGRDVLFGGADADHFQFQKEDGPDTISDFDIAEDVIVFKNLSAADIADMEFRDDDGNTVIIYEDGRLTVMGVVSTDLVWDENLISI